MRRSQRAPRARPEGHATGGNMQEHRFMPRGATAIAVALCVSHGWSAPAARGELAFQFAGSLAASATGNDAFFFTVGNQDLLVTALGQFNGTSESHTVAIYRTDAAFAPLELVISRQIATTTSYSGFQYEDVRAAAAVLAANTRYFIIGNAGPGKQLVTDMNIGLGSGIKSFDAYRWNWSGAHDPVTTLQGSAVYWGSNFQYEAVPAPSTLAVLAGIAGLGRRRRHRTGDAHHSRPSTRGIT